MAPEQTTVLDERDREELISATRTTIGDQLRSITYFTDDGTFEQVYLRSDLEADADLTGFVDYEQLGFGARTAYRASELGEYRFTIRVFERGFLVRVTSGDVGVFLTTDGLTVQDFEEVATAVGKLLAQE
ncbi:hypothetical protein VB773_21215 [Haloarculaceae archaeon H-GB2-1]|nr:hypothetical protein [Haloarculaceae archaeon H-GB1-1]MEA5409840.1 hypothetical protein [Haloarculaceae archaeon H-GB2-1]